MKVCLVGSSGGHLTHLYMLKPFWKDKEHFWVTFDKKDARSLLEGEKMYPWRNVQIYNMSCLGRWPECKFQNMSEFTTMVQLNMKSCWKI